MKITVREMEASDRAAWAEMRAALWPEETPAAHAIAIDNILEDANAWGFIAEAPDGTPAGFAELAVRSYANGCDSAPVPFLEGIWVAAPLRRQGIGTQLIAYLEAFVAVRGFCEIGSDTPIDNYGSQAAHRGWGFSETERVVYFRKVLKSAVG
jgi:aminoglycoside 6'-N-acetyltransferase I